MGYSKIEDLVTGIIMALVAGIIAVGGWLVRTILTNQAQVNQLRTEIATREEKRALELEMIVELKRDVRELRTDVKMLFATQGGGHKGGSV